MAVGIFNYSRLCIQPHSANAINFKTSLAEKFAVLPNIYYAAVLIAPHCGSCPSVRLSVSPGAKFENKKKRKTKLVVNVTQGRSNRRDNFLLMAKVRVAQLWEKKKKKMYFTKPIQHNT